MKCLQTGPEVSIDRKLLVEASEGLEKAKVLNHCIYCNVKQFWDHLLILEPFQSFTNIPIAWNTVVSEPCCRFCWLSL